MQWLLLGKMTEQTMITYKRVLLKLSGEALAGQSGFGIAPAALVHYVREIEKVHKQGIKIAIIVGGGNIWRGKQAAQSNIPRTKADHMGMLATLINAIALDSALTHKGIPCRLMSRLPLHHFWETYSIAKASAYLRKGRIVIIGGGTSNPCATTDSAASLTAIELSMDLLVKGTKVDGVYTADPKKDPKATYYTTLSLQEALAQQLNVMDRQALALCLEQRLPIAVYNATKPDQLLQILAGKGGTLLTP